MHPSSGLGCRMKPVGCRSGFVQDPKQWFPVPDEARWLPIGLHRWPQAVVWARRRPSPTTGSGGDDTPKTVFDHWKRLVRDSTSAPDDRKHPLAAPDEERLRRET